MRMSRVNITVPDEVAAEARLLGLNVSRLATGALVEEIDRRRKIAALDAYLEELDLQFGLIPADERAAASAWATQVFDSPEVFTATPLKRTA